MRSMRYAVLGRRDDMRFPVSMKPLSSFGMRPASRAKKESLLELYRRVHKDGGTVLKLRSYFENYASWLQQVLLHNHTYVVVQAC